jgi:hypothetical protein
MTSSSGVRKLATYQSTHNVHESNEGTELLAR